MADEGSENRAGNMDLNLYLGLPRSPRPRSLDLGSDLALSSLPISISSNSEESRALEAVSGAAMEASASNVPYSPSHAAIGEDVLLAGFRAPADVNPIHEYTPCFPSYEAFVTEGPSVPYSPSNAHALPIEQELGETEERDIVTPAVSEDGSPINLVDDSYAEGSGSHPPYSPPYLPGSVNMHEDERFAPLSSIPLHIGGSFTARGDGSSSQRELLRSSEFRIRRLIESHQYSLRRFRSSLSYGNERSNFARPSPPSPTELMQDIMNSQRSLETNGKHKVGAEVVISESSEDDTELKNKSVANFECNICFDMAKEPVVTSCGHLFCWSCLYQWLHVHSDNKECPVCKGEVTEANIVPIYGRGSSELDTEKTDTSNIDPDLKIPPRPRGNRLESWRQHMRPITRRFGDGIPNSWRRLLNHQVRNRSRIGGHEDALVQEMLNGGSHAVLTRSMTRRLHREEGATGNVPNAEDVRFARDGSSIPALVFQEGNDIWQRLYGYTVNDRLAGVTADIGRAIGRFASNSNRYGPSTSSANAPNPDQFSSRRNAGVAATADQASASSTVAVIQGESSARAASAEPNSAGSSRPYRRRGRSSASGSSDVDGGALHTRKRRRLN
ncbi:hypothetical protein KFK09_010560 [Dendrobium nobile]|uniref:E3 ubiquitin-protein ligase RMA n=1 Tax=Dendrobium nobile TaxID=94219 RepID=A0A8T3BCF4_DENNO|nr:hypothetical protein KFK09_010560 [Dendrobium nobile]